jgi:hypothetical protein
MNGIRRDPFVKSLVRAEVVHKDFTWASVENVGFSYPYFHSKSSNIQPV